MIKLDTGPRIFARVPDSFSLQPYEHLTVTPSGPLIGATVEGVQLRGDLDDAVLAEIRQALLEFKVIVFPRQEISRDDHRAFAERWGELEQHPFFEYVQPGQTDVDVVTLAKDANFSGYENEWHSDITWHTTPSFGAILRAIEIPAYGGDTLWADAGAAYDSLPDELRETIDPLIAVHDWKPTFGRNMPDETKQALTERFPMVEHPVVRIHPETGRRTLYVNPIFTSHIVGLSEADSEALLQRLYRQMTLPELQIRHRWTEGDVAFWDNRSTQHYAASDYSPQRRVMDRISIAGDAPYGLQRTGL